MRRIVLTAATSTDSAVSPMNLNTSPFNVGFGITVTGTINYTVQHTFDDVFSPSFDPTTAVWFDHPTIASQATNQDGNYAFPVVAIRLKNNSGGGTAVMTIVQAGIV